MIVKNCNIIVAVDANMAIGKGGGLLCHLPDDLRRFKLLTLGHPVVMGRKTYESLPVRPLPGRDNYVISSKGSIDGAKVLRNPLDVLHHVGDDEDFFVIGGASVYSYFLPMAARLFVTHINHAFDGADCFFPDFLDPENHRAECWRITERIDHPADERHAFPFSFVIYERC